MQLLAEAQSSLTLLCSDPSPRPRRGNKQLTNAHIVCVQPSHLDGRHETSGLSQEAGDQRCGSNSSMRLAGCVGSRSSTSFKYA